MFTSASEVARNNSEHSRSLEGTALVWENLATVWLLPLRIEHFVFGLGLTYLMSYVPPCVDMLGTVDLLERACRAQQRQTLGV